MREIDKWWLHVPERTTHGQWLNLLLNELSEFCSCCLLTERPPNSNLSPPPSVSVPSNEVSKTSSSFIAWMHPPFIAPTGPRPQLARPPLPLWAEPVAVVFPVWDDLVSVCTYNHYWRGALMFSVCLWGEDTSLCWEMLQSDLLSVRSVRQTLVPWPYYTGRLHRGVRGNTRVVESHLRTHQPPGWQWTELLRIEIIISCRVKLCAKDGFIYSVFCTARTQKTQEAYLKLRPK